MNIGIIFLKTINNRSLRNTIRVLQQCNIVIGLNYNLKAEQKTQDYLTESESQTWKTFLTKNRE